MNNIIFKIGAIVGVTAFSTFPINAQLTVRDEILIAGERNSSVNQSDGDSNKKIRPTKKNYAPLFKGALDLANKRQFTISVPIGNGQRKDVPIRINESGQIIDPLTNQVAVPIDPSKAKNTKGGRIAEEVQKNVTKKIQKTRKETGEAKVSRKLDRLSSAIDALNKYGKIKDVVDIIESTSIKEGIINTGVATGAIPKLFDPLEIASGFITGDFPSYLDDLDGLGTLAIWNHVNTEIEKAINGQNTGKPTIDSPSEGKTQMFRDPEIGGQRLDYCYVWERNCGKAAAQAFCQSKGYKNSIRYQSDTSPNVTRVIGDGRMCQEGVNHKICDGFKYITCGK